MQKTQPTPSAHDQQNEGQPTPGVSGMGFKYQPLPEDTYVRLIKIYPQRSEDPEDLLLAPIVVRLQDAPPCHALSYTWGPRISSDPSITRDLLDCLGQLHSGSPGLFCIDALCNDQRDNDEKSRQTQRAGGHSYCESEQ